MIIYLIKKHIPSIKDYNRANNIHFRICSLSNVISMHKKVLRLPTKDETFSDNQWISFIYFSSN